MVASAKSIEEHKARDKIKNNCIGISLKIYIGRKYNIELK